jgi:hypothetical protein
MYNMMVFVVRNQSIRNSFDHRQAREQLPLLVPVVGESVQV